MYINFFCRFTQKTAKFKLNLTVCPWEYLPPQAEEVKGEVKMTNCYMVAPGGRVDIPTENVYKIWQYSNSGWRRNGRTRMAR